MRISMLAGIAVLVAASTVLGGCCERQNGEIQSLTDKCDRLQVQINDYTTQVSELQRTNDSLNQQVAQKNQEIALKDSEIADLRANAAKPVPTGKTEPGWEATSIGDRVTVGSDVLFNSGRATLTAGGKAALSRIASALKGTYAGLPVRIYGYTDSDPIVKSKKLWSDNLDLSANRAMAVTRYLISRGVSKDSIETIAMGNTHFVASNSSASGKAKNRRVEIYVIKK